MIYNLNNKKYAKKLLLFSFVICVIGCQKQEEPSPENAFDLRTEIIKGKTDEEKKTLSAIQSIDYQLIKSLQ